MNYKFIDLPKHGGRAGEIVVVENVGFNRVFFVFADGMFGGGHAHKECRQILLAIKGRFWIQLYDGRSQELINLDSPDQALVVEPMIWLEYNGTSDGVLAVLCSHKYDENDYIRNFGEYESTVS